MPRVVVFQKVLLLAVPPVTWVSDSNFALPSEAQPGICRTVISSESGGT